MSGVLQNFLSNVEILDALDYVSDSADRNGATLDLAGGAECAAVVVTFAAIAASAVTTVKMQESDDDSSWSDLEGTAISVADDDDDQRFAIEIVKPQKRYLRVVIDKDATNDTAEVANYFVTGRRTLPIDNNVADEITSEIHISPVAGTA